MHNERLSAPAGSLFARRQLIATGAATLALLLPACATLGGGGGLDFARILKDLLGLSSERAFARLLAPDGFFDDQLARIAVPDALGGQAATGMAAVLLRSEPVQKRLLKQVNKAAGFAAKAAEPIVADAISSLSVADARAVVRGGPTAATDLLQAALGASLGARLVPGVASALGLGDSAIISQVLKVATGFDVDRLAADVGGKAAASIFRAIGREEAAIRANPAATNNPGLIAAFSALG
jgi:hypothetical protein